MVSSCTILATYTEDRAFVWYERCQLVALPFNCLARPSHYSCKRHLRAMLSFLWSVLLEGLHTGACMGIHTNTYALANRSAYVPVESNLQFVNRNSCEQNLHLQNSHRCD